MPPDEHPNGWNEWSKHVLKELERLNENYEGLRSEIGSTRQDIAELKAGRSDVDDIKDWKKRMEESISPSQVAEMRKDVDDLKAFKAKSVTIWIVLQAVITIILTLLAIAV